MAAKLTITQVKSPIGRPAYQRATLIGLGLNKLHRTREVTDTPANRGRIDRVKHLLLVAEEASGGSRKRKGAGR